MHSLKKLHKYTSYAITGLAGLGVREPRKLRMRHRAYCYSMWIIAIWLLFQWHFDDVNMLTGLQSRVLNGLVWGYFVVTFVYFLSKVKNKKHYLADNWLIPLIILFGIPTVFEPNVVSNNITLLRPFLALYLLVPSLSLLWHLFIDGKLRTTLVGAAIVVIIFGIIVSSVDPNVHTVWDGVWWASATISSVGYGDVVPTSAFGRVLGLILIVIGIGIFVTFTANFLALILHKKKDRADEIEKKLQRIEVLLKKIENQQLHKDKKDK